MYVRFLLWLMPETWKIDLLDLITKYGDTAIEFGANGCCRSDAEHQKYCAAWGEITDHIGF